MEDDVIGTTVEEEEDITRQKSTVWIATTLKWLSNKQDVRDFLVIETYYCLQQLFMLEAESICSLL